jgi:AraC-like DNA-binding protein
MKRWTHPELPLLASYVLRDRYVQEAFVSHQEHEINLALSGRPAYRFDNGLRMELKPGDILALPAGRRHAMDAPEPYHMGTLHVHPSQFRSLNVSTAYRPLLRRLRSWRDPLPPRKLLCPGSHAAMRRIIEEVVIEQNQRLPACDGMFDTLATQTAIHFLRLMATESAAEEPNETHRRILEVQDWMDRNFTKPISLDDLGREASLAPTYFAARFRSIVGSPPMSYIRNRRINQARLLLRQTNQPVKSIALSVGFSSANRFNHVFKKSTGLTPVEYRQRH